MASRRPPFVPLPLVLLAQGQGRILGSEGRALSQGCPDKPRGQTWGTREALWPWQLLWLRRRMQHHRAPSPPEPQRLQVLLPAPCPHTWLTRARCGAQHPGLCAEAARVWLRPHEQCCVQPHVWELRGNV